MNSFKEMNMNNYEQNALKELLVWKKNMKKKPSSSSKIAKGLQEKMNNIFPDKIRNFITESIKNMVKVVLAGSEHSSKIPLMDASLQYRENLTKENLNFYRKLATASGAGTGASGFIVGLADFPILLSLKVKFLFEVSSNYGFDVRDYKERLYMLYVFQLAFSSDKRRIEVFEQILDWDNYVKTLPSDVNSFDWETFEREYRDYIDLAKMLQLVPGIGLVVGAYVNHKLLNKLGETAINAYRLRVFK
jgi:hypothetical protein